jgi:hypothetical protein
MDNSVLKKYLTNQVDEYLYFLTSGIHLASLWEKISLAGSFISITTASET